MVYKSKNNLYSSKIKLYWSLKNKNFYLEKNTSAVKNYDNTKTIILSSIYIVVALYLKKNSNKPQNINIC